MIDMTVKQFIPAVIRYTTVLAESINAIKATGIAEPVVQKELLEKTSANLKCTSEAMNELSRLVEAYSTYPSGRERALFCRREMVPAMENLRKPVDALEMMVDKEMWPMPSYGDLIFEV